MSKIFGTIAAVVLAAAAFVAMKNKDAYKAGLANYDNEKSRESTTKKDLDKEQARLKEIETSHKEEISKAEEATVDLEKYTKKLDTVKKQVTELKDEHKKNAAKITSANEILKGLPDPDELIPKFKRMSKQIAESQNGLANEESRLANLIKRDKIESAAVEKIRGELAGSTRGQSSASLRTRIRSVYRNWGFVILAAGDSQGVVTGSTLDVMRGGEVVGKLKVTAVEANRASADIVLDSVQSGTSLRSGDLVVATKKAEAASQPVVAPAPPAATEPASEEEEGDDDEDEDGDDF